jgi:hypothetical protein
MKEHIIRDLTAGLFEVQVVVIGRGVVMSEMDKALERGK